MERDNFRNNKEISFLELMRNGGIRIPPIQREYAQGREGAYAIRHGFVEALLKCASENVCLDFVYGVFNEGFLIPLDGQQRLTTLFLFYWYFGAIDKKWKFEYASRRMAMRFVDYLKEDFHKQQYLNEVQYWKRLKPSLWLRSQSEFVPAWESDSTVYGMLVMLDEIHVQASKLEAELTVKALERVTFFFHKCDEAISPDETYLKINARGEALTEWENIKSILDSRAREIVNSSGADKAIVAAAKTWKDKINGEWTTCLEGFLPRMTDAISLPSYIAISIAMLNAAFRNIIDLAAAATINVSEIIERTKKNYAEQMFEGWGLGSVILGERVGASSVKNLEDLTGFFTESFLHHTAIYSDYRDAKIWRDEAFVVVAEIFSVLANTQGCRAVGFWPVDRKENRYWGGDGNLTLFKKEFLFTSVTPTDASLDENEKQAFKTDLGVLREGAYSSDRLTYSNALRVLAVVRSDGSSCSDFALSRCLNLLDAECFNVSAKNFHDLNGQLAKFQVRLARGDLQKAFSGLPSGTWRLGHVIKSEKCKSDLYFGKGNDADVRLFPFWKIEKQLSLMSGAVLFTYDNEVKEFDTSKADYFLENFLKSENVADDTGFVSLMEYMPERPISITLPTSSKRNDIGFSQWRDFLLQEPVEQAFDNLFRFGKCLDHHIPDWVKTYNRLIVKDKWAYRLIGTYSQPFHGTSRVFAYNTTSRMAPYCRCLSYSEAEKKLLKIVRGGDMDMFVMWASEEIPFSFNDRFVISVDSIMGHDNKKLTIWHRDAMGKRDDCPCCDKECLSVEEKIAMLHDFITTNSEQRF